MRCTQVYSSLILSDYRDEINELWRRAATKAVSAGSLYICADGKSDHNTALAKSAAAFADELVIEYQKRRIRHYGMAPDHPVALGGGWPDPPPGWEKGHELRWSRNGLWIKVNPDSRRSHIYIEWREIDRMRREYLGSPDGR